MLNAIVMNTSSLHDPETRSQTAHRVRHNLDDARREVTAVDQRLQRFTRQRPLVAAFSALAVGFVIGRLVSRR
jgi:ElaB/YqjD/DUF883 family membrane-anchored ribosome-binding protein